MTHVEERTLAILGSTGSIGTQALDVVRRNPERFRVVTLSAGGAQPETLARQAVEFRVPLIAVSNESAADVVRQAISEMARVQGISLLFDVIAGPEAVAIAAGCGADVVLNGISGAVGLQPTLSALRSGSILALANKESLVIGGQVVLSAIQYPDQIVPVDSEHSAIAQALRSGYHAPSAETSDVFDTSGTPVSDSEVRRLILTASGGPFRGKSRSELANVTVAEALNHPTWSMGPVVTINSATLMNKGLELIEAKLLFDVAADDITVVVHPQSIVHSMVEFHDGSVIAQASPPDMRLPIALGLSWPERVPNVAPPCDWTTASSWDFFPLDDVAFPAVNLARSAVAESGMHPAVFNAANEEAVDAFRTGKLPFLGIVDTVHEVLAKASGLWTSASPATYDEVLNADLWARTQARELIRGR